MHLSADPPRLETARLRLRPFRTTDVDALYQLYSDPETMRYLKGVRTRRRASDDILAFQRQQARAGYTLWAAELKPGGKLIGRVGLWPLPGTSEVELGFLIARDRWGQGYALEAATACIGFAFKRLGLSTVAAIAAPYNTASLSLLKKLGFKFIRRDRFYDTEVLYHRLVHPV